MELELQFHSQSQLHLALLCEGACNAWLSEVVAQQAQRCLHAQPLNLRQRLRTLSKAAELETPTTRASRRSTYYEQHP